MRLLKARAPGLTHMGDSLRYGDVGAMLFNLDKSISASVSPVSGLCLEFLYEGHRLRSSDCQAREPFAQAVLGPGGNPTNPCYISSLLSVLDGKYPLPLIKAPKAFDRAHFPSFDKARMLCPKAIEPTLAEFRPTVLSEVPAGDPPPLQIQPALVVVKMSEVLAMLLHVLEQAGRPFLPRLDVQVGG